MCDGAQMSIFGDFFVSCIFSEPPAAQFRPASLIRTKATPCVKVWQTSNLQRLRLGEEKKKKPQHENIMVSLFHRVTIESFQLMTKSGESCI